MNNQSPNNLALYTALLVGVLSLAFFLALLWLTASWSMMLRLMLGIAGVSLSSYFLIRYVLERFIYEKIRVIYKTIHQLKAPKGHRKFQTASSTVDIISQTNQEVVEWAQDKKTEIEELKKLEAYRREFLGNVSHELKTPIFNIQGYVLTLLDGGLEDPKINRKYLLRSEQSINRMISIVEDLEKISRLESGEMHINMANFDLVTLAGEVMEFMEMEAARKNIKLHFGRDYDSPIRVYADRGAIQQVLTNLIMNSIKYGVPDGRTKLSFFDMDEHILAEVTDSGIGIPVDDLPRVFERFYRGEKSRTRQSGEGGSGLGLAIVKHLIEAHGQTINVRSTPGVGTTFAFTMKKAI